MKKHVECMLKKIIKIDVGVGLLMTMVGKVVFPGYILSSLVGFLLAMISFSLNSITAKYVLINENLDKSWCIMLSSFLRIILIVVVGFLCFKNDNKQLIAYISGYCSHFISLIIYSLSMKKKVERE